MIGPKQSFLPPHHLVSSSPGLSVCSNGALRPVPNVSSVKQNTADMLNIEEQDLFDVSKWRKQVYN